MNAAWRELFGAAEREARALGVRDLEVQIGESREALTRFANNAIHQNVAETMTMISVRPQEDQRTARAETNRLDADSVRRCVAEAVALMRAQEPDDRLLPLCEPSTISPLPERWAPSTAECSPAERAAQVAEAIAIAESEGQTAAGIYSTASAREAVFNTRGVDATHDQTLAVFSITVIEETSSGWAKASAVDRATLTPAVLARTASEKARHSRNPRELAPGHYTVILEPAAVLDLVGQMFGDFGGTAIEDQRSFLTGRMGEKLFGENITIMDDCRHPLQSGAPFDGEGMARRALTLVERGVVKELAYSRGVAQRSGVEPTGHGLALPNDVGEFPINIVVAGGGASLQDMIRSTPRGILVTRLWYIREVDPFEKMMTGMTRDGTFLIEGGEIAGGVRNFRFNQGLLDMLGRVESLGPAVRASGEEAFDMVAPAMKVHEFNFTEVTRF
ncbi:MAG: TldD/PmbA family protein [Bryobacterales bacterium]|nr:TldD/PmbA family protein [Bryobacterales bacterium]